jgi:hypothetical protein
LSGSLWCTLLGSLAITVRWMNVGGRWPSALLTTAGSNPAMWSGWLANAMMRHSQEGFLELMPMVIGCNARGLSSGASCYMCPRSEPCWSASGVCTPTRTATRWRGAESRWARGRWRRLRVWRGHGRGRCWETRRRSAVRCAGNRWSVWPWCPGRAHPHQQRPCGSTWHEGEGGRGRPEADLEGTGVACTGTRGAYDEPDRAHASPTPPVLRADSPPCR